MDKVSLVNASPPKLHPVSACFLFVPSQKTPGNGGLLEASLPKHLNPQPFSKYEIWLIFFFCRIRVSRQKIFCRSFFCSNTYAPGISIVATAISIVATGIINESRGRQSCYKEWKRQRCKSMQSGERLFSGVILQQQPTCLYFPIITSTILTNTRQY